MFRHDILLSLSPSNSTHTHTQEGISWFITYTIEVSEESRIGLSCWFQMAWENKKVGVAWFFLWLGHAVGMSVPRHCQGIACFESQNSNVEVYTQDVFVCLSKCGAPGKERGWGLKVVSSGPGWVTEAVRALSQYAKAAGSIPGQGTYKNQPLDVRMSEATNQCLSLYI